MIVKCKPVYNFQSVEFEMEVNSEEEKNKMFKIYDSMLKGLQEIAVEQPALQKPVAAKPKEEMATEGQIKFLIGLGLNVEEAKGLTKKQAAERIRKLI